MNREKDEAERCRLLVARIAEQQSVATLLAREDVDLVIRVRAQRFEVYGHNHQEPSLSLSEFDAVQFNDAWLPTFVDLLRSFVVRRTTDARAELARAWPVEAVPEAQGEVVRQPWPGEGLTGTFGWKPGESGAVK